MQLCDKDLIKAIESGTLTIACPLPEKHPFNITLQVQPASIDLRLGNRIVRFVESLKRFDVKDIYNIDKELKVEYVEDEEPIVLAPKEIIFGQIYEQIGIGDCYSARIEGRSRLARLGISIHCTGNYINPGFAGAMPLQIINHNSFKVVLYPFISICQLIVYKLTDNPLISYSERSGLPINTYYGEEVPSTSTLHLDPELNKNQKLNENVIERKFKALIESYIKTMDNDKNRFDHNDDKSPKIINDIKINLEQHMQKNNYKANQAGIMGAYSGKKAKVTMNQVNLNIEDMKQLIDELDDIKKVLRNKNDNGQFDIEIGQIASAQEELKEGKKDKFYDWIKKAGEQVYQISKDIGTSIVVKLIENSLKGQ